MRTLLLAALFVAFATANASAGIVARIDISNQTMTVSEDGNVLYSWSVSTARKGYRTPRGSFRPVRMHKMWYSRKYDNSPMPLFDLLLRRLRDPRHQRREEPRPPGLAWLHPPASEQCADPLQSGAGARAGEHADHSDELTPPSVALARS